MQFWSAAPCRRFVIANGKFANGKPEVHSKAATRRRIPN
jgi:hypothetical protein